MMKKNKINAFTFIELVIVVTILIILWTIWMTSYSWHLVWVRDTNRITQLVAIHDWLETYKTIDDLPFPESNVDVRAVWNVIWYQWYMWKNNLELITYGKWWVDPKDDTYFSYYLSSDRKNFQLMWFLEDSINKQYSFISKTYAADYATRYPTVYGKKLWILTEEITNLPIQENTIIKSAGYLDLETNTSTYNANFSDKNIVTASWYDLQSILLAWQWKKAPSDCPSWFIWVPWNLEFNQKWFCVAKYEMTYSDVDMPDSCNVQYPSVCTANQDWNTVRYKSYKTIVSTEWKYPIANITQQQAIDACKSMWEWYHLITNNEWMTIARNIESNPDNWSSKQFWNWNLYNWVSNDTTLWCNATWWNSEPRTYATKTWPWTDVNCNYKRKHILTNWQEIYDLAWNVWEHVNKANTIDWTNYNNLQTTIAWTSTWTNWDDDWLYEQTDLKKYWSSLYLWTTNGMWNLYYSNWVPDNIFIRGWSANHNTNTWIFTLHLILNSSYQWHWVWFRCAK